MNAQQAKEMDLTSILDRMGVKRKNDAHIRDGFWFFSPFRDESTASLKVWQGDTGLWLWKDFGSGQGGNIIAFANCMVGKDFKETSISEALRWLDGFSGVRVARTPRKPIQHASTPRIEPSHEDRFTLISNKKLYDKSLLSYLDQRGIDGKLAQYYCGQATYLDNKQQKKFYGISFPNIDGGLEIRAALQNKHHVSLGSKNISFILGDKTEQNVIYIFEGFIDFLSYLQITQKQKPDGAAIILNSTSFANRAGEYILNQHSLKTVLTFFDHDSAGQKAFDEIARVLDPQGYTIGDRSYIYEGFHDLNDYLQNATQTQRSNAFKI